MDKPAVTRFPIHDLLAQRWSPRAFADELISAEEVGSLFEAARWAPSCFNEQPWRFLVATRADRDGFEALAGCLMDANRAWAERASILALSVASMTFKRNGKPNRHAFHDVGLATQNLVIQAQGMGLAVHQMAGFDGSKARTDLAIPDGFEPVTMIAIGRPGKPEQLPDNLAERERAPRERAALSEMVFGARWQADFEDWQ